MGEDERLNLERQIRDGQRDLERTENEYLEDLNLRRNEEFGKLQREVLRKRNEYASAQKFDLVARRSDVIFPARPWTSRKPFSPRSRQPAAARRPVAPAVALQRCLMAATLRELAARFGCELHGDPAVVVNRVGTLSSAGSRRHHVSRQLLCTGPQLAGTRGGRHDRPQ